MCPRAAVGARALNRRRRALRAAAARPARVEAQREVPGAPPAGGLRPATRGRVEEPRPRATWAADAPLCCAVAPPLPRPPADGTAGLAAEEGVLEPAHGPLAPLAARRPLVEAPRRLARQALGGAALGPVAHSSVPRGTTAPVSRTLNPTSARRHKFSELVRLGDKGGDVLPLSLAKERLK